MSTAIIRNGPYRYDDGKLLIEINLRSYLQLFDTRDPSPFIERDLDVKAVDYILSVCKETPSHKIFKIIIYFSENLPSDLTQQVINEAINNYFKYSAELITKKIRFTLRQGRFLFIVGTVVLVSCLSLKQWISQYSSAWFATILREGLMILGWVAMWRPIDAFLYSWWPQMEDRRNFRKLAEVDVEVQVSKPLLTKPS